MTRPIPRAHAGPTRQQPADGSSAIAQGDGPWGSLGCLVRQGGQDLILASGHVLTGAGSDVGGGPVSQPPQSFAGARVIGALKERAPIATHDGAPWSPTAPRNLLDAALATVDRTQVVATIGLLSFPTGFRTSPLSAGDYIQICGAASGWKGAHVLDPSVSDCVQYGDDLYAEFDGLVRCEPYAEDGDSGAAVLDEAYSIAGIHLAGAAAYSLFCPISAVLARWPDLEPITN